MRTFGLAVLAGLAACAGVPKRAVVPETVIFDGAVSFRAAPGWTRESHSFWGEDAVVLSSGTQSTARFHLRDGDPEKDELVVALKNAPWDAPASSPAYEVGTVRVAGTEVPLRRRSSGGIREEPGQSPTYFTDEFCVVPLKKGFLLAVFESEDHSSPPSPDTLSARDSGWRAILASMRLSR